MKKLFVTTLLFVLLNICVSNKIFARESSPDENSSVELSFSINWTFGCYKETTFSNLSQDLLAPRFQLDTKIITGDFLHKITADYFFCRPKSAMTQTAIVYKNFDPITGETYYEGFKSNLSFHRIRLQYDLAYDILKNDRFELYVGGNFACNAFLQFEHYPSITGLLSIGPTSAFNYKLNERNSFSVMCSLPLLGYGVRPPYAGCDAQLMKYAEESFMKILTLGSFLSLHNQQAVLLDFEYKLNASDHFSVGLGFDFEYARIAVPKEKPLYYVDGNFKTTATVKF